MQYVIEIPIIYGVKYDIYFVLVYACSSTCLCIHCMCTCIKCDGKCESAKHPYNVCVVWLCGSLLRLQGCYPVQAHFHGWRASPFSTLVGVRGFPLRPIPSLGAMGPGPGHLGKFFSARRRRRRRRPFEKSHFLKTSFSGSLAHG